MKPAIVVLAFNRPKALKRLLDSLAEAEYLHSASLLISLEGNSTTEVVNIARNFTSEKLNIQVLQHKKRLGLRDHVITCGDLVEDYGSLILLEDDLIVDRYFYIYASQSLSFYEKEKSVAGIALYSYEYNEFANLPFTPLANGYSTYPMQIACSWGQCWTHNQWRAFKTWYIDRSNSDLKKIDRLPSNVKNWPESSWKKYFHGFMIEHDMYFIYPYQSYSTNCSDAGGEHIQYGTSLHQVSLGLPNRRFSTPCFVPMSNKEVLYDSFMEPIGKFVWDTIGYDQEEVEVDLQGIKPIELLQKKEFAITSKPSKKAIQIYAQHYRPAEMNLRFPINEWPNKAWILVNTSEIKNKKIRNYSLAWFSYYASMNLKSACIFRALLTELPMIILRKLHKAIL